MRWLPALALVMPFLLLGCGGPRPSPPPYYVIPPGPPPQKTTAAPSGIPSSRPTPPMNNPSVQYFPPPPDQSEYGRGPTPVPRPAANSQPFFTQPPNIGPITGYGPGGMAAPPGSPLSPPYPPGGLMPVPP